MSCRITSSKRFMLTLTLLAVGLLVLGLPQAAFAQGGVDDKNGPFQLEGNATNEASICFLLNANGAFTSTPSGGTCAQGVLVTFGANTDDWQNALSYGQHTGDNLTLTTSFVGPPQEPYNSLNDSTFFGGGSKDTSGISAGPWEWNTTSVNAKDDIEHAFAAAYRLSNGHVAIYFGMDRYDNSGDATAGFWFFQDSTVGLSNTKKGGGLLFTGHHSNKDLLIVSDFSTGGVVGSVAAYEWICSGSGATCDSNGSLQPATFGGAAVPYIECNPTSGSTPLCAVVNGTPGLAAPWGFTNKSGIATIQGGGFNVYDHGEFLEGGIDLQAIFGANLPCFSTFMAETRSSTSTTASLEDLTPPVPFSLCGIKVSKSCNGSGTVISSSEIDYTYSATVTNTGIGPVYNVSLNETYPDGTTGTITVPLPDTCNGIANSCLLPKDSATVSSIPFAATTTGCHSGVTNCPSPTDATNTVTATAYPLPNSGGQAIQSEAPAGTAECTTSVGATVSIKKACDAANGGATLVQSNGQVAVEVFYTAKVCNNTPTGAQGETLTNIKIADYHDGVSDTPTGSPISSLAAGACTTISGSYFPTNVDGTTGRFAFGDQISVTSATGSFVNPTPVTGCTNSTDLACDSISCPICYDSVCTGSPQPSNY